MLDRENEDAWRESAEELGVTMSSYYEAVKQALEEMYASDKREVTYLLDDFAPQFKPKLGTMRAWKMACIDQMIDDHRFYRYHVEEDKAMAEFLTYRDAVEFVFQNGLWHNEQYNHYRLRIKPQKKGDEGEDGG